MANQVKWTKPKIEHFLEYSGINERIELGDQKAIILKKILLLHYANYSYVLIAEKTDYSVDSVARYIRELKDLYDETAKTSDLLDQRTNLTKWEKKKRSEDNKFKKYR